MKLNNKLSVKTVIGNVKVMVRDGLISDGTAIMRVYGRASKLGTGEGDLGSYTFFKGDFRVTNLLTGEIMAGPKLYLPGCASDALEGALTGTENEAIEFAFDIGIKFDDHSATGYVYTVDSLIVPSEDDALNRLAAQLPKLALPEKKKVK